MNKIVITMLLTLVINPLALVAQDANTEEYDGFITDAMAKFPEIPGVAVVVVQKNKLVYAKGFGVANRELNQKADANTLFYIASSTKSFMAMVAALLDRNGKIRLDDPVTKYTKGLTLRASIPDKVTVRNLLTHTSGLRNPAMTFRMAYSGESDVKDMMRVFADATTYEETRYGKYAYDNLGYNIYGLLVANTLQKKWQDLLADKIFAPLGMRHTTAYVSKARSQKLHLANPYNFSPDTGTVVLAPIAKEDNNMQSAGGILTTVSDLGRWLEANINEGKLDGKQVIPAEIMRAVHTGYTPTYREEMPFEGVGEYALGWQIGKFNAEKVVYHHGRFPGWACHISYLPEHRLGVAVLVNESTVGGSVGHVIAMYAYDLWLGTVGREANYTALLDAGIADYVKTKQSLIAAFTDRAKRTSQLTKPLPEYVGRYTNPSYGTMDVTVAGAALRVKMGYIDVLSTNFTQPETIRVELIPGEGEVIKFNTGPAGQVDSLTYNGMRFTRAPA